MRRFLKYEMDRYLNGRSGERKKEMPLVRVENQAYIHYNKGSVVFYALQDYVGEDNINRALRDYVQAVAYQEPPYTFSPELVSRLRAVVPPPYLYADRRHAGVDHTLREPRGFGDGEEIAGWIYTVTSQSEVAQGQSRRTGRREGVCRWPTGSISGARRQR